MPGPEGAAHRGPSGPRAPSEKRKARPGFRTRTHLNCRPGKPFPGPLPRRQREPRGSARPARVGVRSRRAGRTARALAFGCCTGCPTRPPGETRARAPGPGGGTAFPAERKKRAVSTRVAHGRDTGGPPDIQGCLYA